MKIKLLDNKIKKIFITGGAGFIGSHLCDILIDQGYHVTVYDNFSNGRKNFIIQHLKKSKFKLIKGDCLNLKKLSYAMQGHDLVWHLAANTNIINSHEQPIRDLNDCVLATFNVVESMRANKIKPILFASSGAVYGRLCLNKHVDETAGPLSPMSTYAAGKISSEAFISSYCHLYGLKGWIFRFGNVIGKRVTHGVIFDFINRLKKNPKTLLILGDGSQKKNYFLVDECINGMAWAYKNIKLNTKNPCQIINLGTSSMTKVRKIAKIIIKEMGLKKTKIKIQGKTYAWLGDQPRVHLNVNKINSFGWYCKETSDNAVKIAVKRILNKNY